jgi:hypothetical protein
MRGRVYRHHHIACNCGRVEVLKVYGAEPFDIIGGFLVREYNALWLNVHLYPILISRSVHVQPEGLACIAHYVRCCIWVYNAQLF